MSTGKLSSIMQGSSKEVPSTFLNFARDQYDLRDLLAGTKSVRPHQFGDHKLNRMPFVSSPTPVHLPPEFETELACVSAMFTKNPAAPMAIITAKTPMMMPALRSVRLLINAICKISKPLKTRYTASKYVSIWIIPIMVLSIFPSAVPTLKHQPGIATGLVSDSSTMFRRTRLSSLLV